MRPLVSIICLCYNHAPWLEASLDSVYRQSYSNMEVIVIDDASTDNSVPLLKELRDKMGFTLLCNDTNEGNCRSFNKALAYAGGTYIVDLATDDLMEPSRVEEQVLALEEMGEEYGVAFSDARIVDEEGNVTGTHYRRDDKGQLIEEVPSGDVYKAVLRRHFICPPTIMLRRKVLDELGVYDESLAFEDFDLWVRSSRRYKYCFQDALLMRHRRHGSSLSSAYQQGDRQLLQSTYRVCCKAHRLNSSKEEEEALAVRIRHEMRHAYLTGFFELVQQYIALLRKMGGLGKADKLLGFLARKKWDLSPFLKVFRRSGA